MRSSLNLPVTSLPLLSGCPDSCSPERWVCFARHPQPPRRSRKLNAANEKLTRPLKDGFRMEGHLTSAKLEKVYLPADGIVIALRASGDLKILYGL